MAFPLNFEVLKELQSKEAQYLHNLMKDLSRIGVRSTLNLPKIVVFGGRQAGKSSVLEAISHIQFPTKADPPGTGLCTRFATELVLRHAAEPCIHVSVKFADGRESKSLNYSGFQKINLPDIIKRAKEEMGLVRPGQTFTKNVLLLSIGGPELFPLHLVDLPGIFPVTSANQLKDCGIVDDLIMGYLNQENSIILQVISDEDDDHVQLYQSRVMMLHVLSSRTIKIITKSDKPESDRILNHYITWDSNKQPHQPGWHVLRNRASKNEEDDLADHKPGEETFLKSSRWGSLLPTNLGISALRDKLSKIQFDHLRCSLPHIAQEIRKKLHDQQEEFDRLGIKRSGVAGMRIFLTKKADAFQRLVREAVEGRFRGEFFCRHSHHYKLRAQLRLFNMALDYTLRAKGAEWVVIDDPDGPFVNFKPEDNLAKFLEENSYSFPEPEACSFTDLSAELNKEVAQTRSLELPGSTNHNLAYRLFQRQSRKWEEIAQHHIDKVITKVKLFVKSAMEFVVEPASRDPPTDAILDAIVDGFFEKQKLVLKDKLDEIILPYREYYVFPVDREFIALRKARSAARQEKGNGQSQEEEGAAVRGNQDELALREVLDNLEVYYELSLRTFTDNIINLAIESCLIRPLQCMFTPTSVSEMTDERIKALAVEPKDVQSRREILTKDKGKLEEALKFCDEHGLATLTPTANISTRTIGISTPATGIFTPSSRPSSPDDDPFNPRQSPLPFNFQKGDW